MKRSPVQETTRKSPDGEWLARPTLWWQTTVAVALGGVIYVALIQLLGGIGYGDEFETILPSVMMAHGHWSCAFPAARYGPTPLAAPLFPLLAAAVQIVTRVGFHSPFPSSTVWGAHCQNANHVFSMWQDQHGYFAALLKTSLVAWLVLCLGAIFLMRATKLRGTRSTWLIPLAFAVSPPVFMAVQEYFHPQDQLALAMTLFSLGFILRNRYGAAGIMIALAVLSQQFAVLAVMILVVITSGRDRIRLMISSFVTLSGSIAVLYLLCGPQVVPAAIIGTGKSHIHPGSWMGELHVSPTLGLVIGRIAPLALAGITSWWCMRRVDVLRSPVVLLGLLATCWSYRIALEINLYGYYCVATSATLIVRDIVAKRVFRGTIWWSLAAMLALDDIPNFRPPWSTLPLWVWQVSIALTGSLICWYSLTASLRRELEPSN